MMFQTGATTASAAVPVGPHHGSVYHAVDGRDQGVAKGGGEVFKVDRSDLIRQEIHKMASMVIDIRFPCVL